MNPGGMGKRIRTHNRLIGLHHHPGDITYQATRFRNFLCMNLGVGLVKIFARAQPHGNFFQ